MIKNKRWGKSRVMNTFPFLSVSWIILFSTLPVTDDGLFVVLTIAYDRFILAIFMIYTKMPSKSS